MVRILMAILMMMPGQAGDGRVVYQREAGLAAGAFVRAGAWEVARWTGPMRRIGFAATEIVPSWTAATPPGSWVRVELQVPGSGWYVMGRWSYDGVRTTVKGQADAQGRVAADVFKAGRAVASYRLRVSLYRLPGSAVLPEIRTLGAVASRAGGMRARGGRAWGRELAVPRKSQLAHADHGGAAWCSPTATAMVLAYWKKGPRPGEMSWVPRSDPDPAVDHAARHTFDRAYGGTGNWAFNAAYAGNFGLDASVTRMRSLAEVEDLVAAGVPVVTSLAFTREELGYASAGHLMVVTGFTGDGDVIANDPAARGVRATYPRRAFERAWQRSSTGTVYVIKPFRADA
ncbi:C39 family peptidase [Nonomuraea endophytica]|uniref:C39 family peptidase n=1 Tax=Nonomuraea endophytica TaxID=714136 RepID=UPI0037C66EBD